MYDGRQTPPDRVVCPGGTIAHPVLTWDDIRQMLGTTWQAPK